MAMRLGSVIFKENIVKDMTGYKQIKRKVVKKKKNYTFRLT